MSENNESEKKRGNVSLPWPNENSSLANPLLRRWSFNTQVLNVAQHPSSAAPIAYVELVCVLSWL